MVDINNVIKMAKMKEASDIHLICGLKPTLRVERQLVQLADMDLLEEEDMYEIYDYFIMGNIDKDTEFKSSRKLDMLYEHEDICLRVNISYTNEIPTFTLKIVKNMLPTAEELGIPEVAKNAVCNTQGLILVTGKANSGKTTTLNFLVNEINKSQNKKIVILEDLIEYRHISNKSVIVQKEIGKGRDCLNYAEAIKNSMKEDCDVLVIGDIQNKETMNAAIEIADSGYLVIGALNTKTCAETVERIINFYEKEEQVNIKYLIASLLKLVISQRLLKNKEEKLILVPEVMVLDNTIANIIKKEKFDLAQLDDVLSTSSEKGNIGLINSIAKLFVEDKITLEQAKNQIDERNIEILNRTIMQLKIKK